MIPECFLISETEKATLQSVLGRSWSRGTSLAVGLHRKSKAFSGVGGVSHISPR